MNSGGIHYGPEITIIPAPPPPPPPPGDKGPGEEPPDPIADYVDKFLQRNRCPPWNPDLCSDAQLDSVGLHYMPVNDTKPPALTERLQQLDHGLLEARCESLRDVRQRMLHGRDRKPITVLLGSPGAGKSSFAVQLVQLVAREWVPGADSVLPVYVNLAHFGRDYPPTESGVAELVVDAVAQACPRHQTRTSGAPHLRALGRDLVAGTLGPRVLMVLDGMDEMSTHFVKRVKAVAAFMDSTARLGFTFLLTCRHADFVQLTDYTNNLHVQRWDLLPWTRRMAIDYLRSTGQEGGDDDRAGMIGSLDGDDRQHFDPLEVSLRAAVGRPGTRTALHEVWDLYVQTRLTGHLPKGLTAADAITELGQLAFALTWKTSAWEPDARVIEAARRAELLQETSHGPEFAIRPLLHHLAGKELWRQTRTTGGFPEQVDLKLNHREALKCAGAQAGTDARWTTAVYKALCTPADKRTQGNRLWVVAHMLSPEHIASSTELRAYLVEMIALLVMTDDVERARCLEAVKRQPLLLDLELPGTRTLFDWIVASGSTGAVDWLLELVVQNRAVRRAYPRLLLRLVSRTLDDGEFGKQIVRMLVHRLPSSRRVT